MCPRDAAHSVGWDFRHPPAARSGQPSPRTLAAPGAHRNDGAVARYGPLSDGGGPSPPSGAICARTAIRAAGRRHRRAGGCTARDRRRRRAGRRRGPRGPRSPSTTRRSPPRAARGDPPVRARRDERTRTGRPRAAARRRTSRRRGGCTRPCTDESCVDRKSVRFRGTRAPRRCRKVRSNGASRRRSHRPRWPRCSCAVAYGRPRRRRAAHLCADDEGLPCPAPSSPCRFACSRTAS